MTLAPSLRALVSFAATIVLAAIEPTSLCNQAHKGLSFRAQRGICCSGLVYKRRCTVCHSDKCLGRLPLCALTFGNIAYTPTRTIPTPCPATRAENFPVTFPRSFFSHKSRTEA